MSERATFFIDGFNLYYSIANVPNFQKYKWLNLRSLCEKFKVSSEQIQDVYYFTAYAEWRPKSASRHRVYVAANKSFGCQPVFGKFIKKDRIRLVSCNRPCTPSMPKQRCGRKYTSHEEKLTDVNIAVHMLKTCVKDECDSVYMISGDNDLIPALSAVHELCPRVKVRVIIPFNARAYSLIETCKANHFKYQRINENHLKDSILPESIKIGECIYARPLNGNN